MRGVHWLPFAGLVLACSGQSEVPNEIDGDPDIRRLYMTVEELPPMPEYPVVRSGSFVAQSAGDYDIHGTWEGHAGLCADIGVMEIYTGQPGLGTALLLILPEGDPLGEYPIVAAEFDFPDAPAALIVVQVFAEPEAFGFQAFSGELELSAFGDRISGKFASTLREIRDDILTHYVGVFEGISVEPLATDYCQTLRDSSLVPDSAAVPDSASGGGD